MNVSFWKINLLSVCIFSAFAFTGCTDELKPELIDGGGSADGNSLVIRIPLPSDQLRSRAAETRADYDINDTEGIINDLHLILYDVTDLENATSSTTEKPVYDYSWTAQEVNNLKVGEDGYVTEKIVGLDRSKKYRLYVVANLDGQEYTDNAFSTKVNEVNLKRLIFDWTKLPDPKNLPMVFESGVITPQKDGTITANMKIAAVKVRCSIIYDGRAQGNSSGVMNSGLQITGVTVSNSANEAYVIKNENHYSTRTGDPISITSGKHYDVSDKALSAYYQPDNTSTSEITDKVILTGLSEKTADWHNPWVYQTVIYLPERYVNETANDVKATSVTFSAEIYDASSKEKIEDKEYIIPNVTNVSGTEETLDTPRGTFYDWVATVSSPYNPMELDVTVSEWNTVNLVYKIHGPYELVVEKTENLEVKAGDWSTMGFRSDIPDDAIGFEFPQIVISGDYGGDNSTPIDFYVADVIDPSTMFDDEGNRYEFPDNWESHIRIRVNDQIPYRLLRKFKPNGEGQEEEGYEDPEGKIIKLKDLNYFHVVAGNLHKLINVNPLTLDAYLDITPEVIEIDMQQIFASGEYAKNIEIRYQTNVNYLNDEGEPGELTITDPYGLFAGIGEGALKINTEEGLFDTSKTDDIPDSTGKIYTLNTGHKTGTFTLELTGLLDGLDFWNKEQEFSFTMTLDPKDFPELKEDLIKTVTIRIKPYTTNYIIHFRDNEKAWNNPHVYVYQLLTLPSDLHKEDNDLWEFYGDDNINSWADLAGKIVGYANEDNGMAYNGGIQYLFSNNVSFRGWKGYGGPDINDPKATPVYYKTTGNYNNNTTVDQKYEDGFTMGFVIYGNEFLDNGKKQWGSQYATWSGPTRNQRYNFDVNLNEDHENSMKSHGVWSYFCASCQDLNSDYNEGNNYRGFPGIGMEKEDDGWWKYTLTGVAMPGRTMMIFCDGHDGLANPDNRNVAHRWPGDYEAGVALFDYADHEGWLLFDGDALNSDQKFVDNKPTNVNPLNFKHMVKGFKIDWKKPQWCTNIAQAGSNVNISGDKFSKDCEIKWDEVNKFFFVELNGKEASNFQNDFKIKVILNMDGDKTITLTPNNFIKLEDGTYSCHMKTEFELKEKIYIAWFDGNKVEALKDPSITEITEIKSFWDDNDWEHYAGYGESSKKRARYQSALITVDDVNKDHDYNKTHPLTNKQAIKVTPYQGSDNTEMGYVRIDIFNLQQYWSPTLNCYHINYHEWPK